MPAFDIRVATPADHAPVVALLAAQLAEHGIATPAAALADAVAALLRRPRRSRMLVAVEAERLVGVAALSFGWPIEHAGTGAWLEELYVEPAARGRGLGTALLLAACAAAAAAGARAVDLEVEASHRRAEALYARAGFRPLPRARWVRTLAPAEPRRPAPPTALAGGCFCGALRYRVDGSPTAVAHCHCTICRRASGAPFVTWARVPAPAFTSTAGQPAELRSTPDGRRTFCAACGTPLTFRLLSEPAWVDVTVGSLDDPSAVTPGEHVWTAHELPWARLDDDLPRT